MRVKIYGRVQRVLFRHSARRLAEQLGIAGWVRNNEDGTVEIAARGSDRAMEQFITWCKKGPPLASVEKIDVTRLDAPLADSRFIIL